jgi:hypothetical protein
MAVLDPRELGEQCDFCGQRYLAVYSVPDEVWQRIKMPAKPVGAGLLCPTCADFRARRAGIFLEWTARVNIDAGEEKRNAV